MSSRSDAPPDLGRPLTEVNVELFDALGHPARALEVLAAGRRSAGELHPLVRIESSHLPQERAVLRQAGLVTTRREGWSVADALKGRLVAEPFAVAKRCLMAALAEMRDLLAELTAEAPTR